MEVFVVIFYYVRHGDPIYNPDSLTPLGELQAEALAKRLSRYDIDEIFASSSNRACLTAAPTCKLLHKEMKILDWCNEGYALKDFTCIGEKGTSVWAFDSTKMRELFVSDEVMKLGKEWYTHHAFAGSNFERGVKRVQAECDAFFVSLGYEHNREMNTYTCVCENHNRVALFAHQGIGMILLSSVLDIPYPLFCTHFDFGHSGVTAIEFSPDKGITIPRVLQLSNDSHIYSEGLPTKYQNRIYL